MMRIDAHVHLWRFTAQEYPWISDAMQPLRQDRLAADLRAQMLAYDVHACVAVQAREKEGETDFLLALASENPWIAAVIGWVDLTRNDVAQRIERWLSAAKLRGFRYVLQNNPQTPDLVAGTVFRNAVRQLQRRSLVYELLISADQLKVMVPFCSALDDHWLVLDHLGKPDIRGAPLEQWRREVQPLADLPHVACKLSGLVTEAADARGEFDEERIAQYLDVALELFGPDRILFGTDWPVCTLARSYGETTGLIERWSRQLSPAVQASLWSGTAQRIYGLTQVIREPAAAGV